MKTGSILLAAAIAALAIPATAQTREVTLAECIELSGRNDAGVRNSSLDLLSAKAVKTEAMWEYFPRISLGSMGYRAIDPLLKITPKEVLGNSDYANVLNEQIVTFAYENGLKPYYSAAQYGYSVGLTAVQPVYMGGVIVAGNRLARLGVESSKLKDRITRRDTRDSVECKYWRIVALQEKEKTLEAASRLIESIEKDVESAVGAGVATSSDLLAVRLRKKELASGRLKLRNGSKLLKMDLFNSIGMEYTYIGIKDFVLCDHLEAMPSPEAVAIPDERIGELDESKLLSLNVEALKLEKKLETGKYKPQVMLGAGYAYNDILGQNRPIFNGMVYATVRVPLSILGKAGVTSHKMDYQIQKAVNEKEYLDRQLILKIRMSRLEMDTAWEQMKVEEASVAVAEDALGHIRSNYNAGLATSSELLQAEYALRSEKEALIDRMIDYRTALNQYLSLTSGERR